MKANVQIDNYYFQFTHSFHNNILKSLLGTSVLHFQTAFLFDEVDEAVGTLLLDDELTADLLETRELSRPVL